MEKNALLFIPDISGFTGFVSETDVEHSGHIISELLEVIIDANDIGLEISEIEGDAVLFFRFGEAPALSSLVALAKKMFISFHEHLQVFERDRICQCGACSTASGLTLKFFAHYGAISKIRIKQFNKLHGEDVIIAHRLMKNSIDSDEYFMLTRQYLSSVSEATLLNDGDWFRLDDGHEEFEGTGTVYYSFASLSELHAQVTRPKPRAFPRKVDDPITGEILIEAPMHTVHAIVADAQGKVALGAQKVILENSGVQRVGSKHTCVLPSGDLRFEIIGGSVSQDRVEFGEQVHNLPLLGKTDFLFVITREGPNLSRLRMEVHYEPTTPWSRLKYAVMRPFITYNIIKKMLRASKKAAEASGSRT